MCEILPVEEHLKLLLREENDFERPNIISKENDSEKNALNNEMPPWYDDKKFKRGQQFYYEYRLGMYAAMLVGLMSILSVPSILKMLIFTKLTSTPFKGYKRYARTLLHFITWFYSDFCPGSKGWKSLLHVRNLHLKISQQSEKSGKPPISHRDMAFVQFGLVSIILTRSQFFGINVKNREDVEGFVHFWRVIGWLLGIDDKYNLCRDNADETIYLSEKLIENYFYKSVRSKDPKFINKYSTILDGLWCLNPFIYVDTIWKFALNVTVPKALLENSNNHSEIQKYKQIETPSYKLSTKKKIVYKIKTNLLKNAYEKYYWRKLLNYYFDFFLFLVKHFPLLSYYSFGFKLNGKVNV